MSAAKGKGRKGLSRLTARAIQAGNSPRWRQWARRRWFAEDVALAMEMRSDGIELWAIALHYGTTVEVLGNVLSQARMHGMDAFPSRLRLPQHKDRSSARRKNV